METDPTKCRHTWKFASFVNIDGVLYSGFACDKCQSVKVQGITQQTTQPTTEPTVEKTSQLKTLNPGQQGPQQQHEFTPEQLQKIAEVKELLNKT